MTVTLPRLKFPGKCWSGTAAWATDGVFPFAPAAVRVNCNAFTREIMRVSFGELSFGSRYDRPFLARLWGYKDWHAIGRGIITPAGQKVIVLFVTKEKQQALTQYKDFFDGNRLHMEGEESHANDIRLVSAAKNGDEIHLLYRERHHGPFTYFGEVHLVTHDLHSTRPSEFVFMTRRNEGKRT